jgi:hypothetical protein
MPKNYGLIYLNSYEVHRSADKSLLAFNMFLFSAQQKKKFGGGLKMVEQRRHKGMWSSGGNM